MRTSIYFCLLMMSWTPLQVNADRMASPNEIEKTYILARPVLFERGPDYALMNHLHEIRNRNPQVDIMGLLFFVMRESIEATYKDKKYILAKLKIYHEMGNALQEYLNELSETSNRLNASVSASSDYSSLTGTALGRMERALQHFESSLNQSQTLQSADQNALKSMIAHDRQFIQASRRLMAKAEAISRIPRQTEDMPETRPKQSGSSSRPTDRNAGTPPHINR